MTWARQIKSWAEFDRIMNEEIQKIPHRSMKGLIESSILIRRDTAHTTPKEFGNLLASWFVVTSDAGKEQDPLGLSGNFVRNTRRHIKVSSFRADHTAAVSESSGLAKANASKGPFLIMGYSMNYAAPVHEMMERHPDVRWTNPQSESKWFENSFKRNKDRILKTIADNARIKG